MRGNPAKTTLILSFSWREQEPIDAAVRTIYRSPQYLAGLEQEGKESQVQAAHLREVDLIGESPTKEKVSDAIRRVAASDVPVFVTGLSKTVTAVSSLEYTFFNDYAILSA